MMPSVSSTREGPSSDSPSSAVLRVEDLSVEFPAPGWRKPAIRVVDRISFHVAPGEIVGLVGESGSGKSTTARAALHLLRPAGGRVELLGRDLGPMSGRERRTHRRGAQMVFQDPYSSLDPLMTVHGLLAEAINLVDKRSKDAVRSRAIELLNIVGLGEAHLDRYPAEFSGGQRQRVAIARALASDPDLLVCDEAVSALDVSTQHQIVKLLQRLREETGIAVLFIAHDLAVVRKVADRTLVMYGGWIVEEAPSTELFAHPQHPYTVALLSAVPIPAPRRQRERERILLTGDVPNPASLPAGCRFQQRCPFVMDRCRSEIPLPQPSPIGEVRCHLHDDGAPPPWEQSS